MQAGHFSVADVQLCVNLLVFLTKERRRIIRDNLTACSVPLNERNETGTNIRVFHMEINTKVVVTFNVIYEIK